MKYVFLLLMIWMSTFTAFAQTEDAPREALVERADTLVGQVVDGERIQRLIGNVRVRQQETHLSAERATRFRDRREIHFAGDVLITERGDSLRADSVYYDEQTKTGRAVGRVWLTDGEVIVTAPTARYHTRDKHAIFEDGVTLVDSSTTLRSRQGEYWSEERRAEFAGDIRLDETESTLVADSVTYFRDDEVSIARGTVVVEHRDDGAEDGESARTYLFGEHVFNDNQARFSRITGFPLLVQIRYDSLHAPKDTLAIRAETLEATRSDSLHRLIGKDAVRIWQNRMAATADSLVYDRFNEDNDAARAETAQLFGNPISWMDDMQLSGDTLRMVGHDGRIDTLLARSRSFVATWDSTLERIHQVKGKTLTAIFQNDTLRTMRTGPNAEAIYFLKDDDDALRGGVQGSGDEIIFRFQRGELHQVAIVSGTQGLYVAAEDLTDLFQLDGLSWQQETRPTKNSVLAGISMDAPLERRRREIARHTDSSLQQSEEVPHE